MLEPARVVVEDFEHDLEPFVREKAELIGRGSFFDVYSGFAKERQDNDGHIICPRTEVAIKIFTEERRIAEDFFTQSVELMKGLKFPTLTRMLYSNDGLFGGVIVGLRQKASLDQMLQSSKNGCPLEWTNSEGTLVRWNATKQAICAFGIAAGLCYMHEKKCIHRTIAAQNILLDENMYPLIDGFSLACRLPEDMEDMPETRLGVPIYVAPEVIRGSSYGCPADVYSYGILIHYLVTLEVFPALEGLSPGEILHRILSGYRPDFADAEFVPNLWKELAMRCWDESQDMRPTMREVVDALKEVDISELGSEVDIEEMERYRTSVYEYLEKAT